MKENILSVIGLFLPVLYDQEKNDWVYSISVGSVPLGWIIIAVAVVVKFT